MDQEIIQCFRMIKEATFKQMQDIEEIKNRITSMEQQGNIVRTAARQTQAEIRTLKEGAEEQKQMLNLLYKYNPNQPRVPAGSANGGQWTDGGGGAGSSSSRGGFDSGASRTSGRTVGGRTSDITKPRETGVNAGSPTEGTQRRLSSTGQSQVYKPSQRTPKPVYKNGETETYRVSDQDWDTIQDVTSRNTSIGEVEKYGYERIWSAEGGFQEDHNGAVAGVMKTTLEDVRATSPTMQEALKDITEPADLRGRPDLVPDIYKEYFDKHLEHVGGSAGVEKIGNPYAAAALMDTVFRDGRNGGALHALDAVNKTYENHGIPTINVTDRSDVVVKERILEGFSTLSQKPDTLSELLDNLAEERLKARPDEKPRIDYFRFEEVRSKTDKEEEE